MKNNFNLIVQLKAWWLLISQMPLNLTAEAKLNRILYFWKISVKAQNFLSFQKSNIEGLLIFSPVWYLCSSESYENILAFILKAPEIGSKNRNFNKQTHDCWFRCIELICSLLHFIEFFFLINIVSNVYVMYLHCWFRTDNLLPHRLNIYLVK